MDGWRTTTIGEACNLATGGTPSTAKPEFFDGGSIKWLVSGDVHQKEIFDCDGRITELGLCNSNAKPLPVDSVIIAINGQGKTRGTVALLRTTATCNQSIVCLEPKNRHELSSEFLFWYLESRYEAIRLMTGDDGNDRRGLNMPLLRLIPLPMPSLPEQKRIVAVLDEAIEGIDKAIANTEQNLANSQALFQSHLEATCRRLSSTSRTQPLSSLCNPDRVITYGVIKLGDHQKDGVPCLRTSNVRWLHVDEEGIKKITQSLSQEYRRTILSGGEVLVNVRGTLGGVAVAAPHMMGWNVSREVAVVPVDTTRVVPEFIAFHIGSYTSQAWLTGVLKGVAYTGINIEDLRNLPIPMPPMADQAVTASALSEALMQCRAMEGAYFRKLQVLREFKQSLLEKAFSGRLSGMTELTEAAE